MKKTVILSIIVSFFLLSAGCDSEKRTPYDWEVDDNDVDVGVDTDEDSSDLK